LGDEIQAQSHGKDIGSKNMEKNYKKTAKKSKRRKKNLPNKKTTQKKGLF